MSAPRDPPAAGTAGGGATAAGASVRGERAAALVSAAQSVQARASSILAAGLMIVLGGAALSWYYAHALTRPARARQSAQANAANRAQGEMPLPALGRIEPAMAPERVAEVPLPAPESPLSEAPARPERLAAADTARRQSPRRLALEQPRVGAVPRGASPASSPAPGVPHGPVATEAAPGPDPAAHDAAMAGASAMSVLLSAPATPGAVAQRLASTRFLLPKGAFIDCTLGHPARRCRTRRDLHHGRRHLRRRRPRGVVGARHQAGGRDARSGAAGSGQSVRCRPAAAGAGACWRTADEAQARTPTGAVPLDSPGATNSVARVCPKS